MTARALCPLCRSTNSSTLKRGVRYAKDLNVQKCKSCHLTYLWPQPSDQRLNEFYANEYRAVYSDPVPEERYDADIAEAQLRVTRLSPSLSLKSKILEIGSGSGAFLTSIESNVQEVVGVEMDEPSRKWFSNISTIPVYHSLKKVPPNHKFDMIVAFHVLEHLADPITFLKALAQRLTKNGMIVIEVPNINDALLSLYKIKEFEEFYFSIAHLIYFNSETLTKCAESAFLTGHISGLQRYDLSNHIFWALNKKPGGHGLFNTTISESTRSQYISDLKKSKQSDTLWGIFRKIGPEKNNGKR